jgi:hypothetical protein
MSTVKIQVYHIWLITCNQFDDKKGIRPTASGESLVLGAISQ